ATPSLISSRPPHPPTPPLFPYTTLFRSPPATKRTWPRKKISGLVKNIATSHQANLAHRSFSASRRSWPAVRFRALAIRSKLSRRSEEHTSELQSLAYLVCRLLLEKKKKN